MPEGAGEDVAEAGAAVDEAGAFGASDDFSAEEDGAPPLQEVNRTAHTHSRHNNDLVFS